MRSRTGAAVTVIGCLEIALLAVIVGLVTRPLGGYLARVYAGQRTLLQRVLGPLENALYRLAGIKPEIEQSWLQYTISLLVFHALAIATLYALLRLQAVLPLNPQDLASVPPDLALNTAVSFVTNTSWQSYGGETTLSYLSQMFGIAVHSFLSAASGMRRRHRAHSRFRAAPLVDRRQLLGWMFTRGTFYVLLPVCAVAAFFLMTQGVQQADFDRPRPWQPPSKAAARRSRAGLSPRKRRSSF